MKSDPQIFRLRWAMLPVMAASVFFLFFEPTWRLAHNAVAKAFHGASGPLVLAGEWLVPMLVGLLVCYPMTRVYGRRATLAALAAAVAASGYFVWRFSGASLTGPLVLCVSVPLFAAVAQRALADEPQLAWVSDGASHAGTLPPAKLAWALLPLLAIAFFALHDLVQDPAIELAFAPTSRMGERLGMLAVSVVKPFLVAWPIAWVCALVYGRRAAWVGALVALPTAGRWAWLYLASAHLPWVKAAYSVELLGLVLFLPLIAARMQRRLGDGKLLLAPTTTPPPA